MAWLSSWEGRPIGSFGSLAIFCLYKTFGLPDGGCVVGDGALPSARGKADPGIVQATIHHGAWLAQKSAAVARVRSLSRSHGPQVSRLAPAPEGKFDLGDPDRPATRITTWLIPRIATQEAAGQRRRNYRFLLDAVGSARPLFEALPEGASPVGLPLVLKPEHQPALLEALRRRGIAGSRFWPVPHPALEVERFPGARSLRSESFMLPVHQEIPRASLEAMVEAMQEAATL